MKYIYQHLGLGDHLICNGLIRELNKKYGDITLFVKPIYLNTLKAMYADISSIFLEPKWDHEVPLFIQNNKIKDEDYIKIVHEFLKQDTSFDRSFYGQMNVDFEKRWSSFYIPRNKEKEGELYTLLVKNKDYMFIHTDPSRGFGLKNIPVEYQQIIPSMGITENIFDYCEIIEKAKEVHCYPGSFLFLIDSIPTIGKLSLHMYVRRSQIHPIIEIPVLKKEWNIIG
jgi:hypothetical protein